ncbi:MAG: hypothetical protein M1826_001428 [Phylliscum demangeonii]|nr:MAG: hypothetical protein M1826_001428 [Phylliscum demangeonii]
MPLSKSTRILILLAVDSCFFLLELTVGYSVHSLALVADSFHMLNDVLSLCVGLWAVKVAHEKPSSSSFTYGWQRAETLGALVNGVFLVALCLSIFLEAIQRLVEPQTVSNPKLVLIVGCLGLLSNLLGLLLFHDHGHGHGHAAPAAPGADRVRDAEQGDPATAEIADERGNIANVLPGHVVLGHGLSGAPAREDGKRCEDDGGPASPNQGRKSHHQRRSGSRRRFPNADDINVHPASFRQDIIAASRLENIPADDQPTDESEPDDGSEGGENDALTEHSPLLPHAPDPTHQTPAAPTAHAVAHHDSWHTTHKHARPSFSAGKDGHEHGHGHGGGGGGHSHSHGDLNMRGVFLHVLGDALGNVGVIGSALFIWLTPYWWRFYSDPVISLLITVIILASALPLCKAASRILLQAVPAGLSIEDIKDDIEELPGIVSCHHLHVWQLSDTKVVASLHVQVAFDFKGEGSARYMALARAVRRCLHAYGIHSSTIQPEFCLDPAHGLGLAEADMGRAHDHDHDHDHDHGGATVSSSLTLNGHGPASTGLDGAAASHPSGDAPGVRVIGGSGSAAGGSSKRPSRQGSPRRSEPDACLLECGDECGDVSQQCCVPTVGSGGAGGGGVSGAV